MAKNGWHQPVQQGTRSVPPCGGNPASHPAIQRGTDITRSLESMRSKPLHELLGVIKQQVFTVALAGDAGLLGVLEKFVRCVRADGPHHAGKHGKKALAVFMAEELDELLGDAGLDMSEPRGIGFSPAKGLHLSGDLSLNYIVTARAR